MREKKWTPGPWGFNKCGNFSGTLVAFIHKDNKTLFQTRHNADNGEESCNADAALISAAPELLEELQYLRRFVNPDDVDCGPTDAAIAKAYGECAPINDQFDRYEDKRMDAMDMEQEMRKGMDDE